MAVATRKDSVVTATAKFGIFHAMFKTTQCYTVYVSQATSIRPSKQRSCDTNHYLLGNQLSGKRFILIPVLHVTICFYLSLICVLVYICSDDIFLMHQNGKHQEPKNEF